LIAVGGLHSQDDSGWGVLSQHQRVGKGLEDGPVVVDVLFVVPFYVWWSWVDVGFTRAIMNKCLEHLSIEPPGCGVNQNTNFFEKSLLLPQL
jgi:hypothetical protein